MAAIAQGDGRAGWPATPGVKVAVARMVDAERHHAAEARRAERRQRRSRAMSKVGEALANAVSRRAVKEGDLPADLVALLHEAAGI